MRRPLRKRIWFYAPYPSYLKPQEGFFLPKGWWKPYAFGGDEFNWHTFVLGHPVTGRVVFAYRKCDWTGRCAEDAEEFEGYFSEAEWPVDCYGHNHSGVCNNEDCVCNEEEN